MCLNNKVILLITLIFFATTSAQPFQQFQPINVGAFFFENEYDLQKTFESTIERINTEDYSIYKFFPIVRRLSITDTSVAVQDQTCELINNGVAAIFGPSSQEESDIVSLICNNTGIPHIRFDVATEETMEEKFNHQMTVNVFPSLLILSKAYSDIVTNFGWRKFTLIYDADDAQATTRLQDLLQLRDIHSDFIRVQKFRRDDDYRVMWKGLKGERRIVLDCSPDLLVDFLNSSTEFNLTRRFNHLFLTNLETHTVNLEELNGTDFQINITAARLKLNGNFYDIPYNFESETPTEPRKLLPDLVYDAVQLFVAAIRNVTFAFQFDPPHERCDFGQYRDGQGWEMGKYINHVMKATFGVNNTEFRSADMQFDDDGQRVNFEIEIYSPMDNEGIAVWNTKGQIKPLHGSTARLKKLVYRVATRIGEPYFMEDPEAVALNITGNERYRGYAVDLIKGIANILEIEYIFVPVDDNSYGKYDKTTKQWDGIIGELVNNDAHMGICDLTITQTRKKAVDFTVPFMQLGISILGYKTQPETKTVTAFLDPFLMEVWIYVLIFMFLVSFASVFVARISKPDWENPHPCNKDPDKLENMWNFNNCLYLIIASITTAGCDILPKSAASRAVTAMWWIFAIIIANSYTANLAAFLTNSQMAGDISDVQSLTEQTEVKFGTIEGGSTFNFFAESNDTVFRKAFNLMNKDDPSAYADNNVKGVERVLKNAGKYMFLMETTTIEYNTEKNCELQMIGEKFGEKHYAIAVPMGAEYRMQLNVAILNLSETGSLQKMKKDWWVNKTKNCPEQREASETQALLFEEVRGMFYTLGIGVGFALIFGIGEFLAHVLNVAAEEKISFGKAFRKEMLFVIRVWDKQKPIEGTPSSSLKSSSSRRSSEKTIKSSKSSKSSKTSKKSCGSRKCSEEMRDLQIVRRKTNGIVNNNGCS